MRKIGTPLLLFLLLAVGGNAAPKVSLGPETTVAIGPLDKDGYIIYEAALNERLGKGITPEKNANVLLWKALGPRPEGGNGMPAEFFKQLGIEEPPEKGDYFVGLDRFMKDNLKLTPDEIAATASQQEQAINRPWAAKDYSHLVEWLTVNEKPLALVVEATRRPDYFNPMVSRPTETGLGGLIGVMLPGVQRCRELARALTARAMLRISEGKFDEAWQDLLACHRLGRLVARGATLIESLVGIAIDYVTSNAELAYLEGAQLDAKQLRDRLRDLQALPPIPSMADKIDLGERFMFLDCLQMIRRGGAGVLGNLAGLPAKKPDPQAQQGLDMIDWEPAFRNGNLWYNRLVAALRQENRAEREKQLNKIEEDLKDLKKNAADPENIIKVLKVGANPDKAIGKALGDVLVTLLMPAVSKVQNAADRAEQIQRNQQIAFALAAYRLENKRYPAKLDDLAPKYVASVPDDLFSGKSLNYLPAENGYLLYSVGANGKDEGGRWYDDEPPGDDPRVRMPLSELKRKK